MKFLRKINRLFLMQLTFVLLVLSLAGYFVIKILITNNTKERLLETEFIIIKQIEETGQIPYLFPLIEIKQIDKVTDSSKIFKEIFVQDEFENEVEPYIELSSQTKIKNLYYSIKLRQSAVENEDLQAIIAISFLILILTTFGILYLISLKVNKTIWSEFENNLKVLESFNFDKQNKLSLTNSNIEEFDRLNKVLKNLTDKLSNDYDSLKEFTENASHEIQTPLAIVLLNLEEVLQHDLSEQSFSQIIKSINALKRLSLLNKSLILLTKIENEQFSSDVMLNFNELINAKLVEFKPMFEVRNLLVEVNIKGIFLVKMNISLADILINNLLSNAINHNSDGGKIEISIFDNSLTFCNTGEANVLTNNNIFDKFSKHKSESFGLGLAVVKKICITHNLQIEYKKGKMHCFKISKQEIFFNKNN